MALNTPLLSVILNLKDAPMDHGLTKKEHFLFQRALSLDPHDLCLLK